MTEIQKTLSDIVVYKNYAKYNETLGRRETYEEIVMRVADFFSKKYPDEEATIMQAFSYVLEKKIVPSMRMMQFAGKPIDMMPNRAYNCSFMKVDDPACFHEMMYLLLGGSGVGFSVEKHFVSQLPTIKTPSKARRYMVQDSIVGWADAVKALMKAYFEGSYLPLFDYSDIRPQGAELKTSGGRAPGPDPLDKALHSVAIKLRGALGRKLKPIEVFDIMSFIADAVLAGGIRRSATICTFSFDDIEMLNSKQGDWFVKEPQRCRANISVALQRTDPEINYKIEAVMKRCKSGGYGEPGLVFLSDDGYGYNPCGEIYLEDCSFCNLTEAVYTGDVEEMVKRLWAATYIATLQGGLTDFFYLREKWKRNCERNPLIGVSMTGICSGKLDPVVLSEYNRSVQKWNEEFAEKIGINSASRVTCIKPSGSTSLTLGTSSGVHPWYSKYFIRTVEIEGDSPLFKYLVTKIPKEFIETSVFNYKNFVIKFPIEAPDGAVTNDNDTTEGALQRIDDLNRYYIGRDKENATRSNNVSCTIYMKEDADWEKVTEHLQEEFLVIGGVSLYPYSDAKFEQPVLEAITKEEYNKAIESWADVSIDLREVVETEDNTTLKQTVACAGGACELEV